MQHISRRKFVAIAFAALSFTGCKPSIITKDERKAGFTDSRLKEKFRALQELRSLLEKPAPTDEIIKALNANDITEVRDWTSQLSAWRQRCLDISKSLEAFENHSDFIPVAARIQNMRESLDHV